MSTVELLEKKRTVKGYTKEQLAELVGCSVTALRKYMNGTTLYGRYLTTLMEELEISVVEWNSCINVKTENDDLRV